MSGILLYPHQYIHILNSDTAEVKTEVGPKRVLLKGNESQIGGVQQSRVVYEDEYVVIKNPYDEKEKRNVMGERKVVSGPCVISLQYNESIEETNKIHVLAKNQALRLMALNEHGDKKAGDVWQITGPGSYIPNKDTRVLKTINPVMINENEGIYVNNTETSEKRMITGPKSYLLEAQEEFYKKSYSDMENIALGLPDTPSHYATTIRIYKGQVLCILDAEKNERIVNGPNQILLQPDEHIKCLYLSAGKPKVPRQIRAAIINLGPDFMSDRFEVRTKDNAHLSLLLTYKWEFLVGKSDTHLVFSLPDFIGYGCTTLCSKIREEAAKHTFENFHQGTVSVIRKMLFTDHKVTIDGHPHTFHGYYFNEIKFLISEVDVKEISPVNEEINNLLNESIKSNMIIVCNKMERDANLDAQKEKIKASTKISTLKEGLINVENENLKLEKVERAKVEGQVAILKAEAEKECERIEKEGATKIDLDKMKRTIELLQTEEGRKYLELLKARNFSKINQKWYVSSDSKVNLSLQ